MEASEVTAGELQLRVYEAGRESSYIVESAADTIAARSTDPTVRRRALRWKIAATPLIEEASLRSDPVVATVDLWAFSVQLSEYLLQGDGRDAFGSLQPIALAASDTLQRLAGAVAGRVVGGGDTLSRVGRSIRDWADQHPIRGSELVRPSVLSSDWKALSATESSLTGTVASVQRNLLGINSRLGYLNEGMLKRVQWQAQLAAGDLIPPLLERGRTALMQELADQGRQISLGVDAQRSAIFSALAGERSTVMDRITDERVAVVDAIRSEREAVLQAVDAERQAAVASIDSIAQRSIDHAGLVLGRLLLRAFLAFTALVAVIALGALWLVRTRRRDVTFLLLVVLTAGASGSAQAQDSTAAQAGIDQPTAPVVVDGAVLFFVRGVTSYPAERRAADIAHRITEVAADRFPVESLVVQDTPDGSMVMAGNRRLFGVLHADAELEGVTPQVLAQAYLPRVQEAVQSYRREREPAVLGRNIARALAAIVGLMVGFWLGRRLLRRLRTTVDRRWQARVGDLQLQTVPILRREQLWKGLHRIINITAAGLLVVASYAAVSYVLRLFPWTREIGISLRAWLLRPLLIVGAGAVSYLPNLVFLVILVVLTRYLLRAVRLFFIRVREGSVSIPGFDSDWALPTDRIIRLLIVAFALVVAYPYIPGSGSEAFKGVTLMFGLIFSLGSPSVIGNLVAGQSLAFRRAFRVGDRIKVGEHIGEVAQIRLLTTYLRSPKNEQVVIPNSLILNSEVVNYSTLAPDPGLILHTTVNIGYGTPWRQVEAMLLEAAARTRGLLEQPRPFVLQKSLSEFAVVYEINAYTDNPHAMMPLYSALHGNILDLFNEHGVQIMTPAYEGDPEQPKVVPRGQWSPAPATAPDPSGGDGSSGSIVRA
ncbi:MAG TPA: mechanosensitive ion channel domain-containing protein [Gemmatimonadales bacterium]|nr:mechanosensitive ion channel domain-containing protein [Gemmatimonadales bacterium]